MRAERVADLLKQIMDKKITAYMNVVNFAELYYILSRKSKKIAEEKAKNIRIFGVKIIPIMDDILWKETAPLKASHYLLLMPLLPQPLKS